MKSDNHESTHLLQKPRLLAQIRNSWAIIVCEHFIPKDCIGHLWCMYQGGMFEDALAPACCP